MKYFRLPLVLTVMLGSWSLGAAADLTKLERSIRKEPAYKDRPKYCLLAFGPEAKATVWLVRDGDWLYVDSNGNGDLTEPAKRFAMKQPGSRDFPVQYRYSPELEISAGGRAWGKVQLREGRLHPEFKPIDEYEHKTCERFKRLEGGTEYYLTLSGLKPSPRGKEAPFAATIDQSAGGDAWGSLAFATHPNNAPVVHFDGLLTLNIMLAEPRLERGPKPIDFQIAVGTPGLGKGTFAAVHHTYYTAGGDIIEPAPQGLYPEALVRFPSKSAGGAPVECKWILKQRC
jgi:hypothetical protein